jgi:hypothetical protein
MYFMIGGSLSNRMEDILIAGLTGFILYLALGIIRRNAFEIPKMSLLLLIIWPVAAIFGIWDMASHLSYIGGSVGQFFSYASDYWQASRLDADIPRRTQEYFFLSGGIIFAIIFLISQTITFLLLFVGTTPEKKAFRH